MRLRAAALLLTLGALGSCAGAPRPAPAGEPAAVAPASASSVSSEGSAPRGSVGTKTSAAPPQGSAAPPGGGSPAGGASPPGSAALCKACSGYGPPAAVGTLSKVLDETSGLAVSRKNPGVVYAHNDSGDAPRVFALDERAGLLGELAFAGASAVDWEDLAVGPCPSGTCVWVGDVGDNQKVRAEYALYRIDEPALDGKPFGKRTVAAQRFPFTYPDGRWNSETVLVHPVSGEVYLVTKVGVSAAGLYRFPSPLTPGVPTVVERVGTVANTAMSLVTGGDVSPCGDRVLLRTYFSLLEYDLAPGQSLAEALAGAPRSVPVALEKQGEAVAYRAEGRGYLTASEGVGVTLFATGCP